MTAGDQAVEVAMDGLARPVALSAGEIRGGAPVERGHRQDLRRLQAVEVSATRSREQALEPVPVVAPKGDAVFRSQSCCLTRPKSLARPKLPDMQPLPDSDLVVATPERVSFDYQVAGLGTRAIAQVLDILIIGVILAAVYFVALAIALVGSATATLVAVIGSFVVIFGFFWVGEFVWAGPQVG